VKKGEKSDLRIERTRSSLWAALLELIAERGYDELSVQDIAERARVNRTTFHRHYEDKDDLFRQGCVELCDSIITEMRLISKVELDTDLSWLPRYVRRMFECIDADREVFGVLCGPRSNPEFLRIIEDKVSAFMMNERLNSWSILSSRVGGQDVAELFAWSVTSLLIGLSMQWLRASSSVSIDRVSEIYSTIVVGGITELLRKSL
jgi:AcrR family transcriptional regulator